MLKKAVLPLAAAALLSLIAAAPRPVSRESFLPPNNLKHRIGVNQVGGLTEEQYNAVMDRVQAIYGPVIAARGKKLVINRLWSDDTVNASAEQNGDEWMLNMYGGLARDKAITQDGEALVVCHELGHHLGGAPKYDGTDWAANEGEADYFANSKCLHLFFADPATASFTKPKIASSDSNDLAMAEAACAVSYQGEKERALCVRSAEAGISVTALFQELGGSPAAHFDTPDPTVVTQMYDGHPESQCRLDTYYQASLCAKDYRIDMSETDPAVGACVRSQGYTVGLRPQCWYALPLSEQPAPAPAPAPTPVSPTLAALKNGDVFAGL